MVVYEDKQIKKKKKKKWKLIYLPSKASEVGSRYFTRSKMSGGNEPNELTRERAYLVAGAVVPPAVC